MAMVKAQAAMEYLTTYGWAILIIMVVLGAFFALGVFNPNTYSARAQPGACQVARYSAAGGAQISTLQGVCSSEMPKSVALFNGQSSNVAVPSATGINFTNKLTISAWIYAAGSSPSTQDVISKSSSGTNTGYIFPRTTNGWNSIIFYLDTGSSWTPLSAPYPGLNTWHNVVATYNGFVMDIYIDGTLSSTGSQTGSVVVNSNNLTIGGQPGTGDWFNGRLANVQMYNTTLNANEISSMYIEGIGGVPINIQYLTGWWPLNSDMNDYSGLGGKGSSNTIVFSTSWINGYTIP